MKKLGFGFMRLPLLNPSDEASIDLEQVKKMVDIFIQKGFSYIWIGTVNGYSHVNVTKRQ